jgi:transcriptional regulator with XRE-family HTH domain
MKITLKAARVNAGYTQREVAKQLRMTQRSIVNYEQGNTSPTADVLQRLAILYRINIENIELPKLKRKK